MNYTTKDIINQIENVPLVQQYVKRLFKEHFNPWTIEKFHTDIEVLEEGIATAVLSSNGLTYLVHVINGLPTIASINGKPDDQYYFTRKELEELI